MGTFYITTPIYYPNAPPHLGHAYTTVYADILARYHRLVGDDTFFLTGTDEHGLKLQRTAEKRGVHPKEFVDGMADVYRKYWEMLSISYDFFIRTTDPKHENVVREAIRRLYSKGYIYKARYSGWYCVDCEKFYSEGEYEVVNGKPYCPIHGKPLEYLEEETYYFKLSEFKEYLKEVLSKKSIVYPENYAREVLSKLETVGLRDVSIARPKSRVWWAIEIPWDPNYTVYVWFDALLNYLTGVEYLRNEERFRKYWSEVHHVIGKDILWFHTVIWFSILKALDLPPPKRLIVHAFVINKGVKMGKSAGNVIAIEDLTNRYGSTDSVRYLIARIFNLYKDVEVTTELLDSIHNTELADNLGNLVRRVGVLALRKLRGIVENRGLDRDLEDRIESTLKVYKESMESYEVSRAITAVMNLLREANAYINKVRPWEKSEPHKELYTLLEVLKYSSRMLAPIIPNTANKLSISLGFAIANPYEEKIGSQESYKVTSAPILFKKV